MYKRQVSGTGWVDFNDGRRSIEMTSYSFDEDTMTMEITLNAGSSVDGATIALPYVYAGYAVSGARLDGHPVVAEPRELEGRNQVLLSADYKAGESRDWRIQWGSR